MKILICFFLPFSEDAKWGCLVAMVTIVDKVVLSVHKKSLTSPICNYIMPFLKYFFRNLCRKYANSVIWRLKLYGFYDKIVTIATKVNTCVLLLFLWVFHQNATNEPHRLQFYNYQCITHCMILRWSHT